MAMKFDVTQHLLLIRHADTLQVVGRQSDIERELTQQGQLQGEHMREHLANANLPNSTQVLCSTAMRTRQTLQACLPDAPNVKFLQEIYAAYTGDLLNLINEYFTQGSNSIVVVGHNPSLDSIVRWLGQNDADAISGMATGCIAGFSGTGPLSPESWQLDSLFKP